MKKLLHKIRRRLNTSLLSMKGAKIGQKSAVDYRCEITKPKALTLGSKSILYKEVTVYVEGQGNVVLGNRSHIAPYGYILTKNHNLKIGNNVAIGPYCAFFCHSNALRSTKELFIESYLDGDIKVGNNVFIGAHTVITPGTIISDNVAIGANSLVKGKLESGYLYAGSPVKKIKKLDDKQL